MKPGTFREELIRSLNDTFRNTFQGGRVMMTHGIASLPAPDLAAVLQKVRLFGTFNAEADPRGRHDIGSFEHGGRTVIFKIDYYDENIELASEDPADPEKTTRVLTIMLDCEF